MPIETSKVSTTATKAGGTANRSAKSPPEAGSGNEEAKEAIVTEEDNIQDQEAGEFRVCMREAHREIYSSSSTTGGLPASSSTAAAQGDVTIDTPESVAQLLTHPSATTSRKAKRTEQERIDYLRADPYISQVKKDKVFCVLCKKWIRLKSGGPTYCSQPWDLHKKRCLAGKSVKKGVSAIDMRVVLDGERALCCRAHLDDVEVDGQSNGPSGPPLSSMNGPPYRGGLVDLDNVGGRKRFLASSIFYLLETTYEWCDDLTIPSLLTYINAAMPVDKHEEFARAEVVEHLVALYEAGVVLEGDIVRMVD
ncbi:hypothetical protein EST38_g13715 [Candolleomyces aberdarensis]|uniref:Uncharacterized protein n=1 Tax=Candolleomyces aberdarensis TaxID=2316362 RepID=A0A4Q2D028_9AGAR|nr:hypothetical protein EST38_g13715 [Candolleomyces aberdarensis]